MAKSDFYSDGSDLGLDADDGELPDLMTEELPSLSDRGLGLQRKRDLNPELDSPSKKRKTSSAAAQSLREKKAAEREAERLRKQQEKLEKEQKRMESKQKKEEEKRQKEYERAKKSTLQEAIKNLKPGECLKHILVVIDPGILKLSCGTSILEVLQRHDLKYEIQPQPMPNIVTFWREVTDVVEHTTTSLQTVQKEIVEDEILLLLPIKEFTELVEAQKHLQDPAALHSSSTLRSRLGEIRRKLENRNITVLVQGMEKYFRDQKTLEQRRYREQVKKKPGATSGPELPGVSRLDVEEVLLDVQLYEDCNVRLVEKDTEVSNAVLQYTKAIAEAPFKRDRLNTGLSLFVESSGSVKVGKDGQGVVSAWRQQLQQLKNVSAEVANTIMAEYSHPRTLWEAYQKCDTVSQGEQLLQDIVVRRGVGVLATSRRIGKELSKKIYLLMTSQDPETVIK